MQTGKKNTRSKIKTERPGKMNLKKAKAKKKRKKRKETNKL